MYAVLLSCGRMVLQSGPREELLRTRIVFTKSGRGAVSRLTEAINVS